MQKQILSPGNSDVLFAVDSFLKASESLVQLKPKEGWKIASATLAEIYKNALHTPWRHRLNQKNSLSRNPYTKASRQALFLSTKFHQDQIRDNGEPVMTHVTEVWALTLLTGGDKTTRLSALLHDGPEDMDFDDVSRVLHRIDKRFTAEGFSELAEVIDWVTLPRKLPEGMAKHAFQVQRLISLPEHQKSDQEKALKTLRRAQHLKLCDRFDNLYTDLRDGSEEIAHRWLAKKWKEEHGGNMEEFSSYFNKYPLKDKQRIAAEIMAKRLEKMEELLVAVAYTHDVTDTNNKDLHSIRMIHGMFSTFLVPKIQEEFGLEEKPLPTLEKLQEKSPDILKKNGLENTPATMPHTFQNWQPQESTLTNTLEQ